MAERSRTLETGRLKNGPAAAAFLAAGIGALTMGLVTTLAAASPAINNALNLYRPVGPLSGKTIAEVVVWLIAWAVLHVMWKDKQVNFNAVMTTTLILIALGFLGTFPIFFELFLPA